MNQPTSRADEIAHAVAGVPKWRHRIRIGDVVTPGTEDTDAELRRLDLASSYTGQRVLDVGCSDGLYSFEVERRGAAEVVAVDDESSLLAGGKNGFQVASELLGSKVSYRTGDVEDLDPSEIGLFDLVLFLNVLYHLRNPVRALESIHSVVRPGGTMILKTYFQTDVRKWVRGKCYGFDIDPRPKMWLYPGRELAGDPTNWVGPNRRGVEALLAMTGWEFERTLRWGDRLYYRCTKV
jgi:tRNA (mo5U34)-methyltransferase